MIKVIIIMFIISFSTSFSQIVKIPLTIEEIGSGKTYYYEFGLHPDATDLFDDGIEFEKPPFAPPGTLLPYFEIVRVFDAGSEDEYSEVVNTEEDYRALPQENGIFEYTFHLRMIGGGSIEEGLRFRVPQNLDSKITKLIIEDRNQTVEIFKGDFLENRNILMDNVFLKQYKIEMTYNTTINSVEFEKEDIVKIYPNPSNDIINLDMEIKSYIIYNLNGIEVQSQYNYYENKIDILTLKTGVYHLRLIGTDNSIIETTFVKF